MPGTDCPGRRVSESLTRGPDRGRPEACSPGPGLLVAVGAFHPLVSLLRLDRQGGDRARLEPSDADRLIGLLAKPVGAAVEPGEGGVDLGDQLALAIARAQLDGPFGLQRRT